MRWPCTRRRTARRKRPARRRAGSVAMKPEMPAGPRSGVPRFFSIAKVAVQLDVSQKTVRREIKRGELAVHRIGRQDRISELDLAAYIARRRRA